LKLAVQYGGTDYKKAYEDTFTYIEAKKRSDEARKKLAEQKKLQPKAPTATASAKKAGDEDDDDW
jgi:hypothetical protein